MNQTMLSIVIPAFNESGNIVQTIASIKSELVINDIPHEFIVVNDNSTDDTENIILSLASNDESIRLISRSMPRGFGRAVRAGLEATQGDIIIICMADMSDSPRDVVSYYKKINEGYDCVFGSRFMRGSSCTNYPRVKLAVNRVVNKFLQLLFWTRHNDLTNSFKAYRVEVIRDIWPLKASHFNITIELSLNALIRGYHIARVPISWQGRSWGSSNLHLMEMGRRYLSTMLKVWFEKNLILDDIIAEKLSMSSRSCIHQQLSARISELERRLDQLSPPKEGNQ